MLYDGGIASEKECMMSGFETVTYELGRLTGMSVRSAEKIAEMTRQLIEGGVLVKEDGRGNGWILVDDLRNRRMPDEVEGYVFSDKGHAFLFWWGLGELPDYRIVLECDPLVEANIVFGEEGVVTIEDAVVEERAGDVAGVRRLRVVPD